MSAISTTVSQTAGAELLIKCKSAIDSFFGDKIPSGKLGRCKVYMYCPQFYTTTNNYKEVDGFVYYTGDEYGLHVVPDTEYYHYFYGIMEYRLGVTQKDIGLVDEDGVTIEFNIPDSAPVSYEVIAADKKLNVTDIPHKYTETVDIAFGSNVWNTDGSGTTTKKFPLSLNEI